MSRIASIVLLFIVPAATAQVTELRLAPREPRPAITTEAPPPPVVRIDIEPSRAQATAGEGIGVALRPLLRTSRLI